MRPARPHQKQGAPAAPSVALSDDAWPVQSEAASDPFGLRDTDRLAWPTAIAVAMGLSGALWIGIVWLARFAFG